MAPATSQQRRRMQKWATWLLGQQDSLHRALKAAVPSLDSAMLEVVEQFSYITYGDAVSCFTGKSKREEGGMSWMNPFWDKCMRFHFNFKDGAWTLFHIPLDCKGGVYTVENSYLRSNLSAAAEDSVERTLRETLQAWVDSRISLHRTRIRTRRFKEELMMNRWHPDRVMALLEAGIDVEDM